MMMFDDDEDDDLLGHWPWRINSVKTVGVKAGVVEHLAIVKVCVQVVDRHLEMEIVEDVAVDEEDKEGDRVQHLLAVKLILASTRI